VLCAREGRSTERREVDEERTTAADMGGDGANSRACRWGAGARGWTITYAGRATGRLTWHQRGEGALSAAGQAGQAGQAGDRADASDHVRGAPPLPARCMEFAPTKYAGCAGQWSAVMDMPCGVPCPIDCHVLLYVLGWPRAAASARLTQQAAPADRRSRVPSL